MMMSKHTKDTSRRRGRRRRRPPVHARRAHNAAPPEVSPEKHIQMTKWFVFLFFSVCMRCARPEPNTPACRRRRGAAAAARSDWLANHVTRSDKAIEINECGLSHAINCVCSMQRASARHTCPFFLLKAKPFKAHSASLQTFQKRSH